MLYSIEDLVGSLKLTVRPILILLCSPYLSAGEFKTGWNYLQVKKSENNNKYPTVLIHLIYEWLFQNIGSNNK